MIGQERLKVDATFRSGATLERLSSLFEGQPVAALLQPPQPSSKGEHAWPPLAMFKALLPAVWHDLLDVKRLEALEERASFLRFCGVAAHEPAPERTAVARFRRALIAHGLDRLLFEAVTRQLKTRAIAIRSGALIPGEVPGRRFTRILSASTDASPWIEYCPGMLDGDQTCREQNGDGPGRLALQLLF